MKILHKIIYKEFPTHIACTNNKKAPNKYLKINGNQLYSGNMHPQTRKIVVENMKKYLANNQDWANISVTTFPIAIETQLKVPINFGSVQRRNKEICWKIPSKKYEPNWDIGNYGYLWSKVFLDVLQSQDADLGNKTIRLDIIPNDNIKYITQEGPYTWINCNTLEERELIFIIYKI